MPKEIGADDIKRGDGWIVVRTLRTGEKRYQARWRNGATVRSKTFRTRDEASDHLRKIGRAIREGSYTPDSRLTVEEVVTDYLRRGRQRWSANTLATYTLLHRQQITPHIGKRRVVELTPRLVQLWIDGLVSLSLSPSLIENARTVLSGALAEATRLGIVNQNPVQGVKVPTRRAKPMETWSIEQVQRVLAATDDQLQLHAYYLLALMTGMRPGELRALHWEDIELDRIDRHGHPDPIVTCRRSMTRDEHFRTIVGVETKTARNRVIAISARVVAGLKRLQQEQRIRQIAHPAWQATGLVFDRGDGSFLARQSLQNMHVRAATAAGVPRIRLHDLRHTYATIELENGTSPKIVSERMGHSSITITLDRYTHVSADLQRAAAAAMEQRIANIDSGAQTSAQAVPD